MNGKKKQAAAKRANYKIESGVGMPEASGAGPTRYPFAQMKVGESFLISTGREDMQRARNAGYLYGRRHEKKFRCRAQPGNKWRIWRVA